MPKLLPPQSWFETYRKWILIGILILSAGLRLFQLGEVPAQLNRDEAALAYNAYLLSQTGQDEWGRTRPLALESFGDYKLIGYPLLLIPLLNSFGLSDWVVKLPSAGAGIVLSLAVYWLIKYWDDNHQVATIAAGLIAITPVFFFYSRIAFEANVASTLVILALALLVSNHSGTLIKDILSVVLLSWAMLTYNTPFLLLPLIVLCLPLWRGLPQYQRWAVPVVGLVTIWAVLGWLLIPLTSQKSSITLFSDPTTWTQYIEYREALPAIIKPVIGSKYAFFLGSVMMNVAQSFSPQFLVRAGGTHPWHQLPGYGHFYWFEFATLVVGGCLMIGWTLLDLKSLLRNSPLTWRFIDLKNVSWVQLFMGALLPSVVTVDSPHATRSLLFMVGLVWLASYGIAWIIKVSSAFAQQKAVMASVVIVCISIVVLESGQYFQQYFSEYRVQSHQLLMGGLSPALSDAQLRTDGRITVVDPEGYLYILVAWYRQLEPSYFYSTQIRQQANRIGFKYGEAVDRFHFVASPEDRRPDSSVLMEWKNNAWQVVQF